MLMNRDRTVRIFLSSTFRDFGEERDLLVRQVFPALRARLKDRFVELVDVDLRWGITVEEAERGDVLPICLAEIDRSRPYFIGMLGERYGWIPPHEGYAPELLERQPWLKQHQGGKSVTELEILHGVLKNKRMKTRAFFYFRSPAYATAKGGDYLPSSEDRTRQLKLKRRIRERGLCVTSYPDPDALAKRIERDLWRLLDAEFPLSKVPDAFERERLRHEAYAAPRRRMYLGADRYQVALDKALQSNAPRILVEGASGAGKSALLANFFDAYRKRYPRYLVHAHYLGASADSAEPHALVRRLIEFIQRATRSTEEIPGDPQRLMDSLPLWLAIAGAWARQRRTRFIFVLDSLNSLSEQQDLRWWPAFLPKGVTMVVTCLPGPVHDALQPKTGPLVEQNQSATWKTIWVHPLTKPQSAVLLTTYLAHFNKKLSSPMVKQVQRHALATNPLFIRTLAEELRLFGGYEALQKRLDHYLNSQTMDDLFERVLQRVEKDCGQRQVSASMAAIWASRSGLTEKEILGIANLTPAAWAAIRNALDESLLDTGGKIGFAHDYVRLAVRDRYLATPARRQKVHSLLGSWFSQQSSVSRRGEEEPYQWSQAKKWRKLKQFLTDEAMISHLLALNDGYDLISHWLAIPNFHFSSLERVYRQAWRTWDSLSDWGEISQLAFRLSHFLSSKGLNGKFVLQLAQLALDLDRNASRDRPLYGPALSLVGQVCLARGDLRQARRHFGLAFEMGQASNCGADELAVRKYNMARVLLAEDEIKKGCALQEEALQNAREAWGAHSPALLSYLHGLAKVYDELGRVSDALSLVKQAYVLEQRLYGVNDVRTATSLNNLGWLEIKNGTFDRAVSLLRRSIDLRILAYGPDHIELVTPTANLAKALSNAGRYEEAIPVAEESIRQASVHHGIASNERAGSLGILATVLQKSGKLVQAEQEFRHAVAAAEKRADQLGRTGSVALAVALSNLGLFLFEMGRAKEAQHPLRKALALQEELSGKHSHNWAIPAFNLALVLKSFEDTKEEGESLYALARASLL